ncbi:MAG: A24 family peptidase [Cyanobacteria bacterium]|nr:A24 family peptidase [Cyanobacteriota bacterium]
MPALNFNHIAVLIIVAIAAVIDVRTTKIPNKLTFPAAGVGIISSGVLFGWNGALMAVAGWFVGVLVMMLANPTRKMGFGDVKLMAAIGTFIWWKGVVLTFLYFAIIYGAVAIYKISFALPWVQVFRAVGTFGGDLDLAMKSVNMDQTNKTAKSPIALAPIILIALTLAIFLEQPTLNFLGIK